MPHEDSHRHRARRPRTVEHRLAGGHHRNDTGCRSMAVAILIGVPATILTVAAATVEYLT